jgi:hypothetical protein
MRPVYADTSYYLALFNPGDAQYPAALEFSREDVRPIILTDFVLLEIANALCKRNSRQVFVNLVTHLRSDPMCRIFPILKALFEAGLRLYGDRPDKDWSLTDCISFVVMKRLRLTDALTADRHFEQAGFRVLLK